MNWEELEGKLGFPLTSRSLFQQAFTHASYAHERKQSVPDNERLEFLGDAVLDLAVSEYLYHRYPQMSEGELTRTRARVVCESSLAMFARNLSLGDYVRLGKGEELTGGRKRHALLADLFEAFVGALYLDKGLGGVRGFLRRLVLSELNDDWLLQRMDAKSQLQEMVQQEYNSPLEYCTVDTQGPAHHRHFVVEVYLEGRCLGKGTGHSKKEAEQRAAMAAVQVWCNKKLGQV
ncbi:ribonuclease III [Pasteuria penetrans]|uniref:ribonuclease III n=1 Tax=Pasteuria penetrans TaxID=86005 RepID=UPI0011EC9E7E|nr:ribonuclease III [Pasteuria penetrans]